MEGGEGRGPSHGGEGTITLIAITLIAITLTATLIAITLTAITLIAITLIAITLTAIMLTAMTLIAITLIAITLIAITLIAITFIAITLIPARPRDLIACHVCAQVLNPSPIDLVGRASLWSWAPTFNTKTLSFLRNVGFLLHGGALGVPHGRSFRIHLPLSFRPCRSPHPTHQELRRAGRHSSSR